MYDAFYVEYVLTLYTYVHNMSTNHKKNIHLAKYDLR